MSRRKSVFSTPALQTPHPDCLGLMLVLALAVMMFGAGVSCRSTPPPAPQLTPEEEAARIEKMTPAEYQAYRADQIRRERAQTAQQRENDLRTLNFGRERQQHRDRLRDVSVPILQDSTSVFPWKGEVSDRSATLRSERSAIYNW